MFLTDIRQGIGQEYTRSKKYVCDMVHMNFCPCLFSPKYKNDQNRFQRILRRWQKVQYEVANDREFDRNDFAVVVQPFTFDFALPLSENGVTDDTSYLSEDCFHLSQKGSARGGGLNIYTSRSSNK